MKSPCKSTKRTWVEENSPHSWLSSGVSFGECDASTSRRSILIVKWNLQEATGQRGISDDCWVATNPLDPSDLYRVSFSMHVLESHGSLTFVVATAEATMANVAPRIKVCLEHMETNIAMLVQIIRESHAEYIRTSSAVREWFLAIVSDCVGARLRLSCILKPVSTALRSMYYTQHVPRGHIHCDHPAVNELGTSRSATRVTDEGCDST